MYDFNSPLISQPGRKVMLIELYRDESDFNSQLLARRRKKFSPEDLVGAIFMERKVGIVKLDRRNKKPQNSLAISWPASEHHLYFVSNGQYDKVDLWGSWTAWCLDTYRHYTPRQFYEHGDTKRNPRNKIFLPYSKETEGLGDLLAETLAKKSAREPGNIPSWRQMLKFMQQFHNEHNDL